MATRQHGYFRTVALHSPEMSEKKPTVEKPGIEEASRRDFLKKAASVILGTILGLPPLLAGLMVTLNPLRRKNSKSGFISVTPLESLSADGKPQIFKIIANHTDAWSFYPQVPIGNVYLRRVGEKVEALNATCPHLGCMVQRTEAGAFLCPCHNSKFAATGKIDRAGGGVVPSPRDMDTLEIKIEKNNKGEEFVKVKFQKFQPNIPQKIPVA